MEPVGLNAELGEREELSLPEPPKWLPVGLLLALPVAVPPAASEELSDAVGVLEPLLLMHCVGLRVKDMEAVLRVEKLIEGELEAEGEEEGEGEVDAERVAVPPVTEDVGPVLRDALRVALARLGDGLAVNDGALDAVRLAVPDWEGERVAVPQEEAEAVGVAEFTGYRVRTARLPSSAMVSHGLFASAVLMESPVGALKDATCPPPSPKLGPPRWPATTSVRPSASGVGQLHKLTVAPASATYSV